MAFQSINPATGETLASFDTWDETTLKNTLLEVDKVNASWSTTPLSERCELMRGAAAQLRQDKKRLATLVTQEMGKLIADAEAEVE